MAGHAERVSGAYRHKAANTQKAAAKRVCAVRCIDVVIITGSDYARPFYDKFRRYARNRTAKHPPRRRLLRGRFPQVPSRAHLDLSGRVVPDFLHGPHVHEI